MSAPPNNVNIWLQPATFGRALVVVAGSGLFLLLGCGLAVYCLASSARAPAIVQLPGPDPDLTVPPPPQPPPIPPGEKPLVSLPEEEQAKVNQAVYRGIRFLKLSQEENGCWSRGGHQVGYAALPGLTLLEAGVPGNDPAVQKAADFVRDRAPNLPGTYEIALAILFLDRLGENKDRDLIKTLGVRLIAGQNPAGGWDYNCPILKTSEEDYIVTVLEDLRTQNPADYFKDNQKDLPSAVKSLAIYQNPDGEKFTPGRFKDDNSNTQFAILGLWAARRHNLSIDRPLMLMVRRFRSSQWDDGRWPYRYPNEFVGKLPTMTCAGLLGLAVGHGIGDGEDVPADKDPAVQRAFSYLGRTIGRRGGSGSKPPLINLYFLWSVERVAVLFNQKTIDGQEWYPWGVEMLLANQKENGSWQGENYPGKAENYPGSSPVLDTCFGMLFLKQANLTRDLTNKLQQFGDKKR